LLYELKPDWIIECGTAQAGSTLYFANLCDLMEHGRIVTIDIKELDERNTPPHPRITYLAGSTVDPSIVAQVQATVAGSSTVMAILDSDHSTPHVLEELRTYHSLVTPGSYLVVEDTNISGHPVGNPRKTGPMEAVEQFLRETDGFEVDESREKFMVSFNTGGWLRKIHD
jgi:cephalosporin hydroxylase